MIGATNIILITIYFLIVLYIGLSARKKENDEGYLIANRNVGVFALTATLGASLFGGNTIVTFMSFVFEYGASILWAQVGIAVGCIVLALLSRKIKKLADENKFYTFADYFYKKFGRSAGFLAATITFIVYVGFLLIQFIAGGIVLSSITGWPYTLSVLLMGIVVIIYLFTAGFKAVIKTDMFQYVMILLLVVISVFMFSRIEVLEPSHFNIFAGGAFNIVSFFLYGLMIIILGADLWQRIYAGSDVKTVRKSLIYTAIIFVLLSVLLFLIGITIKNNFPGIIPETALVVGFTQILPNYLLGIGLVVLFAAIMSSLDTFIFILSSSFSNDFLARFERFSKADLVRSTRKFSIIIGVVGMLLAFVLSSIVSVFISILGVYFAVFPSLIFSFWFKLKPKAVVLSLVIGAIVPIVAFIIAGITIETAMSSLPAALIFLGVGQLIFKKQVFAK